MGYRDRGRGRREVGAGGKQLATGIVRPLGDTEGGQAESGAKESEEISGEAATS